MASFSAGDLVVFLSPDIQGPKRRPAVVISTHDYHSNRPDAILGLVTSQTDRAIGPTDCVLKDWQQAGLRKPSLFRSFLATRPREELTLIGHLSEADWRAVQICLQAAVEFGAS
jgi:mRNA interferase MazF